MPPWSVVAQPFFRASTSVLTQVVRFRTLLTQGKLKYWQKQCELLQMDLHELQGQLSEEDRRLAENLSDDEDQHKSEA